jgi:hypothetical protein
MKIYLLYKVYKAAKNKWVSIKRELWASSDLIGYQRLKTLFWPIHHPMVKLEVISKRSDPRCATISYAIEMPDFQIEDENRAPCRTFGNPPRVRNYPTRQRESF